MSPYKETQPLASKDVNAALSPSKAVPTKLEKGESDKPKSLDYHRQILQNRLAQEQPKQSYISPSDDIMSPCTKKLSEYKTKHFAKAKPQSLFAKMKASHGTNGGEGAAMQEQQNLGS